MAQNKRWTELETKIALYLYFQLPFGQLHSKNPQIIELSKRFNRTPSSIAMKLSNFASLDPEIIKSGRKGLTGASALDRKIWEAFNSNWSELIIEAEGLLDNEDANAPNEVDDNSVLKDSHYNQSSYFGVKELRIGQGFFRRSVLANYNNRCCITGIDLPELLVASHIVPWKNDETIRHNPRNGLSLVATFDRAFDKGLIGIDTKYHIRFSKQILNSTNDAIIRYFSEFESKKIIAAEKIQPDRSFLQWHYDNVFKP